MRLINGSECAFIVVFNKTCYVPLKSSKHVYVVGSIRMIAHSAITGPIGAQELSYGIAL